jgi:hypothetical protein
MGSVVVDDDVDDLADRHLGLDGVKEPNELLMAVALHTATRPSSTSRRCLGLGTCVGSMIHR